MHRVLCCVVWLAYLFCAFLLLVMSVQGGLCQSALPVGCEQSPQPEADSATGSASASNLLPQLGSDPAAVLACVPLPGLAGTPGPLLPTWRRVAEVSTSPA